MVKAGIDIVLATTPSWKKKRIGLLTNDAALTCRGVPSRKALHDAGFNLIKIFSPEHGLTATGAGGALAYSQTIAQQLTFIKCTGHFLSRNRPSLYHRTLL